MKHNSSFVLKKRAGTFLLLLFFLPLQFFAQYSMRIELVSIPPEHINDSIFVAGSFNQWQPGKTEYRFLKENDKLMVELKGLPANNYQFKFTRGSWEKEEATKDGKVPENKIIKLISDTTIQFEIAAWKDDFAIVPREHTASKQVRVMDSVFFIPQLNRTRRIWVYLPEGYSKSKKHYPVMYMHDGQNLFDNYTANTNEWGVDEALDSLIAKGKPACIVIGIDNGGDSRLSEYNLLELVFNGPDSTSKKIMPEGKAYIDFLVHTLKPFIDKRYRTLPDRGNTIIAGSSLGALISYYAMLQEPDVFGKGGIFSPSFWTNPLIGEFTDSLAQKLNSKFFFYAGEMESNSMIDNMEEVQDILGAESSSMIYSVTDPEGTHNEKAWRKWFAEFYTWIMADGFNSLLKIKD